jgi:hypothetical protein
MMSKELEACIAAMAAMVKAAKNQSRGGGMICGFGFIASPGEDTRRAQAFADELFKQLGQSCPEGGSTLNQGKVIDGVCTSVAEVQKLPRLARG